MNNQIIVIVKSMENDNKRLEKLSNLKDFEEFYLFLKENGYQNTKEKFNEELIEILNQNKLMSTKDSELDCVAGGINFKGNLSKALSVGMASLLAISSSPLQLEAHASSLNNSSRWSKIQSLSPQAKNALSKASMVAAPTAILGIPVALATAIFAGSNHDSKVSKTKKVSNTPIKAQSSMLEKVINDLGTETQVLNMLVSNTVLRGIVSSEISKEINLLAETTAYKSTDNCNIGDVFQWLVKLNKLTMKVGESLGAAGNVEQEIRDELINIQNKIDDICCSLSVDRDQLDSFGKDEVAQEELRILKEDLKQSQEREKYTQEELSKSERNIKSYEQMLEGLKKELKVAEQKVQEMSQNLYSVNVDKAKTQDELREAQWLYRTSLDEHLRISNKIKELEELKKGSDKEIETLKTELNAVQETKKEVEAKLEASEDQVKKLELSDKASKETIQNLETQLELKKETHKKITSELKEVKGDIKKSDEKFQEQTQSFTAPVADMAVEQSFQAQTEQAQAVPEVKLSNSMIKFIDNYGKYFNLNKENCKVKLSEKEMRSLRHLASDVRTQFKAIENLNEYDFKEAYKDCVPENFEQCLKMLCQRIADAMHYHCCEEGIWEGLANHRTGCCSMKTVAPLCGERVDEFVDKDFRKMKDVLKDSSLDMWMLTTFLRAKTCEKYKTPPGESVDTDKELEAELTGLRALECIDEIKKIVEKEGIELPYFKKFKELAENGEFDLLFEKFVECVQAQRAVVVGNENGADLFLKFNEALNEYIKQNLESRYDLSDKYMLCDYMRGASWGGMFNYFNMMKDSDISDEYGIIMSKRGYRAAGSKEDSYFMISHFGFDKVTGKTTPLPLDKNGKEYYGAINVLGIKGTKENDQQEIKADEVVPEQLQVEQPPLQQAPTKPAPQKQNKKKSLSKRSPQNNQRPKKYRK